MPEEALIAAKKPQIRPRLAEAIRLIVTQGMRTAAAAEAAGMKVNSLQVALRRPHVRAYRDDVKRAWMNSELERSWVKVVELRDNAASEKVQLEAAKTVISALEGDLDEGRQRSPTLIQLIRADVVNVAQPLTERRGGVVQRVTDQAIEGEVLDHDDV